MKVRDKYYRLVERYLAQYNNPYGVNYMYHKYYLPFWKWYKENKDKFTEDEKEFFKKYVIITPHKDKRVIKDVESYDINAIFLNKNWFFQKS